MVSSPVHGGTKALAGAVHEGVPKSAFGWDDATAYAHIGISGMNGLSRPAAAHLAGDLDADP